MDFDCPVQLTPAHPNAQCGDCQHDLNGWYILKKELLKPSETRTTRDQVQCRNCSEFLCYLCLRTHFERNKCVFARICYICQFLLDDIIWLQSYRTYFPTTFKCHQKWILDRKQALKVKLIGNAKSCQKCHQYFDCTMAIWLKCDQCDTNEQNDRAYYCCWCFRQTKFIETPAIRRCFVCQEKVCLNASPRPIGCYFCHRYICWDHSDSEMVGNCCLNCNAVNQSLGLPSDLIIALSNQYSIFYN